MNRHPFGMRYLPVMLIAAAPFGALAQSVPSILNFDGHELWLNTTQGTPDTNYTADYFPRGETGETWTERFTLKIILSRAEPDDVADDVVKRINNRKEIDQYAAANAYTYGVDGSALVIYTVSDRQDTVEHDVHRYFKSGDKLITYQYGRRFRYSKVGVKGAEAFFSDSAGKITRYLNELERPDLPLRPAPTKEEVLIRAAAVKKLAALEIEKEDRRVAIRKDFQAKKISGTEAMSRLKALDTEPAPPDDTLMMLKPTPLKPKPVAASKVKPEQKEAL